MTTKDRSKLSDLQFRKIEQKKAAGELKKILYNHMNLSFSAKTAYSVEFLGRKFLFALNSEFVQHNLLKSIVMRKGILGTILSYDAASGGYMADKIVVSAPHSSDKVSLQILDLRGKTLYEGAGKIQKSAIDFTIIGLPVEGSVRTTISGTIGRSAIIFKDATMPNKIYKKRQSPSPKPRQAKTDSA